MQTLEQHIETPSFFNGPTLNPSFYMMHKKAGSGIGGAGLQIVSSVKNKYPQGEKEEEQIVRSKDTNQMFETRTAKPMITQARNNAEAVEGGGVNSIVPPANARSSSVIHCWPCQPTYCRSSVQILHSSGGWSLSANCVPHVMQMYSLILQPVPCPSKAPTESPTTGTGRTR